MQVDVTFAQTSLFKATLTYEAIAEAIAKDIKEETGEFTTVPSLDDIKNGWLKHCPITTAGSYLSELLEKAGREVDAFHSAVESMEEAL